MRPALISAFSASVLRCFGADTIEASTICPLIAKYVQIGTRTI
jgi:hypothetical protein